MTQEKIAPSFIEQFRESYCDRPEGAYYGDDLNGRYESRATLHRDRDADYILETRRYFYSGGRLRRTARILIEDYGESLIQTEEWNEDGSRQFITSYGGVDEWLWERSVDHKTGCSKTLVNRDSFVFFNVPEDMIGALEDGTLAPERLLDIRWEDAREAILEILGATKVVPGLPMQTIDRLGSNRLLKMEWRDRWGASRMESWCFLKLHCTTTGKISYLRVPPGLSDIMSAIAWTFEMDKENYRLEKET